MELPAPDPKTGPKGKIWSQYRKRDIHKPAVVPICILIKLGTKGDGGGQIRMFGENVQNS